MGLKRWEFFSARKPSETSVRRFRALGILRRQLVSGPQPLLDFRVDIRQAGDLDAVGDAVFFSKAARVDEASGRLAVSQRQPQVDTGAVRRLDLREDVLAVKRHDRLAWANLHAFAERQ